MPQGLASSSLLGGMLHLDQLFKMLIILVSSLGETRNVLVRTFVFFRYIFAFALRAAPLPRIVTPASKLSWPTVAGFKSWTLYYSLILQPALAPSTSLHHMPASSTTRNGDKTTRLLSPSSLSTSKTSPLRSLRSSA